MLPHDSKAETGLSKRFIKHYLFKMANRKQMDFDLALLLMLQALRAPSKLYLHTKRLKQIRNHWYRDDPCLTAVILVLMLALGILYGIVTKQSFGGTVKTACCFVLLHFVAGAIACSAAFKWAAERFMIKTDKQSDTGGQRVSRIEPMYAFDVHCNGFFPVIVFSYIAQVSF